MPAMGRRCRHSGQSIELLSGRNVINRFSTGELNVRIRKSWSLSATECYSRPQSSYRSKKSKSIKKKYSRLVPLKILMNKFDGRTLLSREILSKILEHNIYRDCMLHTYIRQNQDFANHCAASISIFDSIKPSTAKEDIDFLTQEMLDIFPSKTEEKISLVSIEATV